MIRAFKFGIMLAIVSIAFASCDIFPKDDPEEDAPGIKMVTERQTVEIRIAGEGEYIIDWGDGNEERETFPYWGNAELLHTYSGTAKRTIVLYGDNITMLQCSGNQLTSLEIKPSWWELKEVYCEANQLTSLVVKDLWALERLLCNMNKLTSLDVSGCESLMELGCRSNQLSAEELNKLFQTLRRVENGSIGVIHIVGNPGASDNALNPSIAVAKRWMVLAGTGVFSPDLIVSVAGNYTYNGAPIVPSGDNITVRADNVMLTAGTDYTLTYAENTNAGMATVTATGAGNYAGKTGIGNFYIARFPISVTADPISKSFWDSDPPLTYTTTPALFGSDVLAER